MFSRSEYEIKLSPFTYRAFYVESNGIIFTPFLFVISGNNYCEDISTYQADCSELHEKQLPAIRETETKD